MHVFQMILVLLFGTVFEIFTKVFPVVVFFILVTNLCWNLLSVLTSFLSSERICFLGYFWGLRITEYFPGNQVLKHHLQHIGPVSISDPCSSASLLNLNLENIDLFNTRANRSCNWVNIHSCSGRVQIRKARSYNTAKSQWLSFLLQRWGCPKLFHFMWTGWFISAQI